MAGSKTIVFKGTKIRKSTTLSHAESILLMISDEILIFPLTKSIPPSAPSTYHATTSANVPLCSGVCGPVSFVIAVFRDTAPDFLHLLWPIPRVRAH